jgi:hypothetical protein
MSSTQQKTNEDLAVEANMAVADASWHQPTNQNPDRRPPKDPTAAGMD